MIERIILIRHGESNANVMNKFSGFQDVDLTEKGIWQAKRLAQRLKNVEVDKVYCSDLKRAHHTAKIVFGNREIDIIPRPNLKEMNFGVWEGYTFEEVKLKFGYGEEFNYWTENTNVKACIPKGESLIKLNERVMGEFNKILKFHESIDKNETISIVCHGGTIRVILVNILHMKLEKMWNIAQYSTALNIISYSEKSTFINLMNDISHLEDWWEYDIKRDA
jgi:broad specificity phosphatase PhoE